MFTAVWLDIGFVQNNILSVWARFKDKRRRERKKKNLEEVAKLSVLYSTWLSRHRNTLLTLICKTW